MGGRQPSDGGSLVWGTQAQAERTARPHLCMAGQAVCCCQKTETESLTSVVERNTLGNKEDLLLGDRKDMARKSCLPLCPEIILSPSQYFLLLI